MSDVDYVVDVWKDAHHKAQTRSTTTLRLPLSEVIN